MTTATYERVKAVIAKLPQGAHIPDVRIHQWTNKVLNQEDGKPLDFHLNRLGGVGGSESGSIMAHYHDSAAPMKLEDGFKSADDISREKLLLSAPFSTPYAIRGNRIEPFIRDIFVRKFKLEGHEDSEAMQASVHHANNPYMRSSPDDIFFKKQRILVDYKSISRSSLTEKMPLSHITQLHHYNENMLSNDYGADIMLTANLVGDEALFWDMIKAYENRQKNPEDYAFWVNAILQDKLGSARLIIKEQEHIPEYGKLVSSTITRFMNEYPIAGKTISASTEQTVLVGDEVDEATKIEAKMFTLMTAKKAMDKLRDETIQSVTEFAKKIESPFAWPSTFPVNFKSTPVFNIKAAVEALELSGVNTDTLYVPSETEYDTEKLLSKIEMLGGAVDESLRKQHLEVSRVKDELTKAGLNPDDFVESHTIQPTLSRRMSDADQKEAQQIDIEMELRSLIENSAENEIMQLNEFESEKQQHQTGLTF